MARTSPTQLPSEEELLEILSKESQRLAVRYDYMAAYPTVYDAYKEFGAMVGVDMSWVDNFDAIPLSVLKQRADYATSELIRFILNNPADYSALFDALNVNDTPEPSDCIFVFGAKSDARIKKAVDLYHQGLAPRIVVSGRGPHYGVSDSQTEAARMHDYALAAGVPKEAIIVEDKAITLPDNVKRTIDMFEAINWRPIRIIGVSTTFVQRRTQLEWYKFLPWQAQIFAVSCEEEGLRASFCRVTWSRDEMGVRLLLNEYNKIIVEQAMDLYRNNLRNNHVKKA